MECHLLCPLMGLEPPFKRKETVPGKMFLIPFFVYVVSLVGSVVKKFMISSYSMTQYSA